MGSPVTGESSESMSKNKPFLLKLLSQVSVTVLISMGMFKEKMTMPGNVTVFHHCDRYLRETA
jgi:hypothetical protein